MSTYSFLEITFSYYHVHSHLLLSFGGENSSSYDFYNQIRPSTGIVSHKNRGREEFSGVYMFLFHFPYFYKHPYFWFESFSTCDFCKHTLQKQYYQVLKAWMALSTEVGVGYQRSFLGMQHGPFLICKHHQVLRFCPKMTQLLKKWFLLTHSLSTPWKTPPCLSYFCD